MSVGKNFVERRVVPEALARRIKAVEIMVRRQPDVPASVALQTHDYIAAGTVRILRSMTERAEFARLSIKRVQTATVGGEPERSIPIFNRGQDRTIRNAVGVAAAMTIEAKSARSRIDSVEYTVIAHPKDAVAVLKH